MHLTDAVIVERDGDRITVWDRVTVCQDHTITPAGCSIGTRLLAGDGSTDGPPSFITPGVAERLDEEGFHHTAEVVDPTDEEVTVL